MGEIHDFEHPEDDEKPGRDGKQYCGGRDDVQNECGHAGLRVASMLPKSGMSLLGASGNERDWRRSRAHAVVCDKVATTAQTTPAVCGGHRDMEALVFSPGQSFGHCSPG